MTYNPDATYYTPEHLLKTSIDPGSGYLGYSGGRTPIQTVVSQDGTISVCMEPDSLSDDEYIYIYEYNTNLICTKTLKIKKELAMFGAFTKDSSGNYYIFYGYSVPDETKTTINMALAKYNSSGTRTNLKLMNGSETGDSDDSWLGVKNPFRSSNCRIEINGDNIAVYLGRLMYVEEGPSSDGLNHQASYAMMFNKDTLAKVSGSSVGMLFRSIPYSSHSFGQLILPNEDGFVFVDLGDAYPRAIMLTKVKPGVSAKSLNIYNIKGATGLNSTWTQLGGIEKTSTGYIVAASSEMSASLESGRTDSRNLFIATANSNLDSSSITIKWLTNYANTSQHNAVNPKMVKIENNRYVVMWEDVGGYTYINTHYMIIDENGNIIKEDTIIPNIRLNMYDIIRYNPVDNKIYWAVNKSIFLEVISFDPYAVLMDEPTPTLGVRLNIDERSLSAGSIYQLVATVLPTDAVNKDLTWSSSNETIATVDSTGKVTAIGVGTATITVTSVDGNKTATCNITVTPVAVTSVYNVYSGRALYIGETFQNEAGIRPANATNKNVTWSSSAPSVLSVSTTGLVTALTEGTAVITFVTEDGGFSASTTYTSKKVLITSISFNLSSKTIEQGENFTITATCLPDNAANKELTWASNNSAIATVDDAGKVTGVGIGSTIIRATAKDGSGKSASCSITVTAPKTIAVTGVTLDQTSKSVIKGTEFSLTATVAPTNATNKEVTWNSSNTAVATVDGTGKVTTVGVGSTTIKATAKDGSGKSDSCAVTVTAPVVTGVTLDQTSKSVVKGAEFYLTATVAPANATNKEVTWNSSNTAVATVDNTGKVTTVGAGTTTITATTTNGNKTATCNITVSEPDGSEYLTVNNTLRESGNYISNIDITQNTVDYIIGKTDTNLPIVQVYNKAGTVITGTTKIGTGTRIVAKRADGTIVKEYTIIIYGDTDGDGKITTADALSVQRFAVRLETFNDIQKTAGNTRGTGTNPTTADALNIQRHAVRLYTIQQ